MTPFGDRISDSNRNINYNYSQLMNWGDYRFQLMTRGTNATWQNIWVSYYNYRRIIKFIGNLAELRKFWKVNKINYSAKISKMGFYLAFKKWWNLAMLSIRNEKLIVALIFLEDCQKQRRLQTHGASSTIFFVPTLWVSMS